VRDAQVVLGDPCRLKATSGAGVEELAVAKAGGAGMAAGQFASQAPPQALEALLNSQPAIENDC
jgi:hypothetical protein